MGLRAIFHLVTSLIYVYICYFDYHVVKGNMLPIPNQFLSKFVWLTLICLYTQTFYNLVGFLIASTKCQHGAFHYFARVIVGPVGMSVVLLFWTLFLFDPNTLLADENAKRIIAIKWYNHGIHTLPLITVLLDLIVWNHGQPSRKATMTGIAVFSVLYIIDIHYVYYISGFWAYPILGQLSLPFRILFIAVCVLLFYISFLILSFVHRFFHVKESNKFKNK